PVPRPVVYLRRSSYVDGRCDGQKCSRSTVHDRRCAFPVTRVRHLSQQGKPPSATACGYDNAFSDGALSFADDRLENSARIIRNGVASDQFVRLSCVSKAVDPDLCCCFYAGDLI